MQIRELTNLDKDVLLGFFKHYLDQNLRSKLMNEHPQIYNAFVGHEVVKTVRAKGDEHKGEEIFDFYDFSREEKKSDV